MPRPSGCGRCCGCKRIVPAAYPCLFSFLYGSSRFVCHARRRDREPAVGAYRGAGVTVGSFIGRQRRGRRIDGPPYPLVEQGAGDGAHDRADPVDPLVLPHAGNQRRTKRTGGFIEAPLIGPAQSALAATVKPMASEASSPTARVSVATAVMTNIRAAVSNVSSTSDCSGGPLGTVDPSPATTPKRTRSVAAARMAPASCPPM